MKWTYCLWFDFVRQQRRPSERHWDWVNAECYAQAQGSNVHDQQSPLVEVDWAQAWPKAARAHREKRETWTDTVLALLTRLPDDEILVDIDALRFKGARLSWQGGGKPLPEESTPGRLRPREAFEWLRAPGRLDALWAWPELVDGADLAAVRQLATRIRKPSIGVFCRRALQADARADEVAKWLGQAFDAIRSGLLAASSAERRTTADVG
ncbi:MAG: hypothetical protein ACOYOB_21370 [Myxococcota bacterium]